MIFCAISSLVISIKDKIDILKIRDLSIKVGRYKKMDIILAGYEIPVDILEKSNCISQHTGLELERIKVNANIEGEEINEKIIDYLGTAREEGINSKEGQITRKWKLGNYSTSYSDKECVNYSLELEEIEEIKLDRLILDDLELIGSVTCLL